YLTQAGYVSAANLARWDRIGWSLPLSPGLIGTPSALAEFDDGTGPALYAGGTFALPGAFTPVYFVRWDGRSWSAPERGPTGPVRALVVHDDGRGSALFVGGEFQSAGCLGCGSVARWDGRRSSSLASGTDGKVLAFAR